MTTHGPFNPVCVEPDWHDVLARSAAISSRRRRRLLLAAATAVVVAAIAGPALATSGWLQSIFAGTRIPSTALSAREVQSLQTLTTRGKAVPLSEIEKIPAARLATLRRSGLRSIHLLGQTQGLAFYAFDFRGGRRCYDAVRQAKIIGGIVRCSAASKGSATFPSPQRPVIDLSLVGADAGQPMHTIQLQGIAADGVATVGVIGSDGNIYGKTPVVGNVYVSKNLPPQAAGPTIAYDATGTAIWCFPYTPRGFPTSVLDAARCPNRSPASGRWHGQP